MQKQRDTKAIKRIPVAIPEPAPVEVYELTPDTDKSKRDASDVEKQNLYDLGGSLAEYKEEEKEEKKEDDVSVEKTKEGISVDQAEQEQKELNVVPQELKG